MSVSYFKVCSNKLFWLKETLAHSGLNAAWSAAAQIEGSARSVLVGRMEQKLQKVLGHAAKSVPYYRKWFAGRMPHDGVLRIEDFPIVSKTDIRGHEEEFVAEDYPKTDLSWTRTSGSTGEPFRFAHGKEQFVGSYAALWRGLARFGIRPGDRRVLVKGVDEVPCVSARTKLKRLIYGWINRCIVVDAHFLARSEANIAAELKRIVSYKPTYFHGYVSSIFLLAQYAEQHGIDLAALKVKVVVTESEKCHDFQRELIERVFKAPVVENYGCVEFGMIAQPAQDGVPCINEDHVYVETTADGEAVITNLDEYGFPLIRFKNGDRMTLGPVHATLPYRTIQSIEGRIAETIHLPQGGSLQGYIVMYPISKHMQHLKQYQVYQPDIGHLIVRVVPTATDFPANIQSQILTEMREIVGLQMQVTVEKVETIPLTKRGKRAFVVSDVRRS